MQNLEEALDATVLTVASVHGDKGHVVTAGNEL